MGRPRSPCPSLIHDFQFDLSVGQDEVGGHLLFPVGEPAAIRGPAATEPDGSSTEPLIHGRGGSDVDVVEDVPGADLEVVPAVLNMLARAVSLGMASLDDLNMHAIFHCKVIVMRTVPVFFEGSVQGSIEGGIRRVH